MKTAYAILALTIAAILIGFADTDHGSQRAFSASIRAAGHFSAQ